MGVDTLTMSSLATNFTLGLSDDDSSEMTNDDFILKILNRIIDIALSTVEKQVTFKLMLTRWRSSSTIRLDDRVNQSQAFKLRRTKTKSNQFHLKKKMKK